MKKKRHGFLYCILLVLLYLIIDLNYKKLEINDSNEEFVNNLLKYSNSHLSDEEVNIVDSMFAQITDIDINTPVSIIDKVFAYQKEESDYQQFWYIQNTVVDKPRVYIYSTHPKEGYTDTDLTVVKASLLLQEKLNALGIQTIVEPRNSLDYIKENNIEADEGYAATRIFLNEALKKYGSFDLVIDLHRDSVPNTISTKTTINGKDYAKIMFVMNKNLSKNFGFAEKINSILESKYNSISRGIYDKHSHKFNQDLTEKAVLIELGSTKNTYDEVINSVDALTNVIKELLNEE